MSKLVKVLNVWDLAKRRTVLSYKMWGTRNKIKKIREYKLGYSIHNDWGKAVEKYIDNGSHNISFTTLDISIIDEYTCIYYMGKIDGLLLRT